MKMLGDPIQTNIKSFRKLNLKCASRFNSSKMLRDVANDCSSQSLKHILSRAKSGSKEYFELSIGPKPQLVEITVSEFEN